MNNAAATAADLSALVLGTCIRCAGLGRMEHFGHVAAGTCFQCKGDGLYLYTPKAFASNMPRAARLEVIRQAIAAFDMVRAGHASCDDFLRRNRKAVRTMLFRTIRENATACGPVVWDRAYAALAKVEPIDMAKVASLRAKAFATVAA